MKKNYKKFATWGIMSAIIIFPVMASAQTTTQTLEQRIAARKEALKTKLDSVSQNRIQAKCTGAQQVLKNVQERSTNTIDNRLTKYQENSARLDSLLNRLNDRNVNAEKLEQAISKFKQTVEQFKVDVDAYNQTLNDLVGMKCVDDPVGFIASLDSLRQARQKLAADSKDIRLALRDVFTELSNVKLELANNN